MRRGAILLFVLLGIGLISDRAPAFFTGGIMTQRAPACVITALSLSNNTFDSNTSNAPVGTASTTTTGTCGSPTYSIVSSGTDHSGTTCSATGNINFTQTGSATAANGSPGAGTYTNVCLRSAITSATGSPFTQAITITGAPANQITSMVVYNTSGGSISNQPVAFVQPFAPAAVASGNKIEIRKSDGTTVVTAQEDACSTWLTDGSRKACSISFLEPDTITTGSSATYKIYAVSGAPSTGCNSTLTQIRANTNFIVKFTAGDLGSDVFDVDVNDILTNGSQLPASGSPKQYWEYYASGARKCGIRATSYLKRESDSAYHKWIKADIYVDFWGSGVTPCPCSIAVYAKQANIYGAVSGATVGAATQPGYVYQAELYNGASLLYAWGGPNDWRAAETLATSAFTVSTGVVTLGTTNGYASPGSAINYLSSVPVSFSSSGSVPTGLSGTMWATFRNASNRELILTPTTADATGLALPGACISVVTLTEGTYAARPGSPTNGQQYNFSDSNVGSGSVVTAGGGTHHVNATWDGSQWNANCEFKRFSTQGTGTITMTPLVATFPFSGWVGLTDTGDRVWMDASGALTTKPPVAPGHNFNYLTQTSRAMPPYINGLSTLDQSGTGLRYYPWSYMYPWDLNTTGDAAGDERIGWLNHTCALALFKATDQIAAQNCRGIAASFTREHAYLEDETVGGQPPVLNNGHTKNGVTYAGMGPINANNRSYPGNGGNSPGWASPSSSLADLDGLLERYSDYMEPSHMPAPWIVPYLRSAGPEWLSFGTNQASQILAGYFFGSQTVNGVNYYKPLERGSQPRGTGWGLRVLGQVHHYTPAAASPAQYWGDMTNDQCGWVQSWSQFDATADQASIGYWQYITVTAPSYQNWMTDIEYLGYAMLTWTGEFSDCTSYVTNWAGKKFVVDRGYAPNGGCLWGGSIRNISPFTGGFGAILTTWAAVNDHSFAWFGPSDPTNWAPWVNAGNACPTPGQAGVNGLYQDFTGAQPFEPEAIANMYAAAVAMASVLGVANANSVYNDTRTVQYTWPSMPLSFTNYLGASFPEWAIGPLGATN